MKDDLNGAQGAKHDLSAKAAAAPQQRQGSAEETVFIGGNAPAAPFTEVHETPDFDALDNAGFRRNDAAKPTEAQLGVILRAFSLKRAAKRFFEVDEESRPSPTDRSKYKALQVEYMWMAMSTARAANRNDVTDEVLKALTSQLDSIEVDILRRGIIPKVKRKLAKAASWSLWWLAASVLMLAILHARGVPWLVPDVGYAGYRPGWLAIPAEVLPIVTTSFFCAFGAFVGRFISFMALYRNDVTSEDDYNARMKEIPHRLGPIRDAAVAIVVLLALQSGVFTVQFFQEAEGFDTTKFLDTLHGTFLLGTFVGLVLPLVVDRLIFGAKSVVQGGAGGA